MTIYFPDISAYQDGIDLAGALAVSIKATQGTNYSSPTLAEQVAEANKRGAFHTAYHFLTEGADAGQAELFEHHAGRTPAMVDCEPSYDSHGNIVSAPTLADLCGFVDHLRELGGVIHLAYLPRWWWQELGSPSLAPLTQRGLLLVSSQYQAYSDSPGQGGWEPYGGMTPTVWQYSETTPYGGIATVDFNAYRGRFAGKQDHASVQSALADFRTLCLTGKLAPPASVLPPVRELKVVSVGPSSVRLSWVAPAGPSPFKVDHYQTRIQQGGSDLISYPRVEPKGTNPESDQFGSLPAGHKLVAQVRAVDPTGNHASGWQAVPFTTKLR